MLPQKTFLSREYTLAESDFDVTGYVKPQRVMEIMQDLATAQAEILGFGWDLLNSHGLFWVLSKVKIIFNKPITRQNNKFKVYTWPVAPNKFFIERRFVAVGVDGNEVFAASTIWMMIERDTRKIADTKTVESFYKADFDNTPCIDCNLERIRKNDEYSLAYKTEIRRSQLDINKHVNNTHYVNFAVDTLAHTDKISQIEITYHKELKYSDAVEVYLKRTQNAACVAGERNGETAFTAKLVLEQ